MSTVVQLRKCLKSVIHIFNWHHSRAMSSNYGGYISNWGGNNQTDPWIVIRDTVIAANPTVDLFKADAEGITACHLACMQP